MDNAKPIGGRGSSDHLRLRYAPWKDDETLYPVGRFVDGELIIQRYKRREFPSWVYTSKFNRYHLNANYTGWRCFVTDAQCYYMKRTNGISLLKIPFVASLDHLVPMREYRTPETSLTHRLRNQTVVAGLVNKNIGHIPLALKILHRQVLSTIDYNRENPTIETFWTIKHKIIETENQFLHWGRYPWQPWCWDKHRKIADDFMQEMKTFDENFLAISDPKIRSEFIKNFCWRW